VVFSGEKESSLFESEVRSSCSPTISSVMGAAGIGSGPMRRFLFKPRAIIRIQSGRSWSLFPRAWRKGLFSRCAPDKGTGASHPSTRRMRKKLRLSVGAKQPKAPSGAWLRGLSSHVNTRQISFTRAKSFKLGNFGLEHDRSRRSRKHSRGK